MSSRLILAAVGAVALAACSTAPLPQAGSLDAGIGEATKYNAAIQIIDPDPVYPADAAQPGDSGVKAAAASRRYRTDQVKETDSLSTTRSSGASGSGGSGGSGPR